MWMLHPNSAYSRLAQAPDDQPHLPAARRRARRTRADPHLRTQVPKGALGVEPALCGRGKLASISTAAPGHDRKKEDRCDLSHGREATAASRRHCWSIYAA
jgi:hypothetical protein